jgi:SAM-dependent methyltransferase
MSSGAGSDYYDAHSDEYHMRTFHLDPSEFLKPLLARLAPGASLLDVGCSSGRDLCWFRDRGLTVMGFEGSGRLAVLARKNAECTVIEGDFTTYDFSSLEVDAIILVAALVHVPRGALEGVLKRISSALRRGGHILITMKEGDVAFTDRERRTFSLWRDEELRPVFDRLGLSVCDFCRRDSKLGTGEIWLEYVVRKGQ